MPFFKYYLNIPVLTYHKVTDDFEIGLTNVGTTAFYQQMAYLKDNGYQSVLPNDYESLKYIRKRVIISFDDAYENIYTNAFPIMEEFGFTGLIFPIVNYIGRLNRWDANLGGVKFNHASKNQLLELSKHNWEIGSHSLNHVTWLKEQDYIAEIVDSKKALSDIFSSEIKSFSYPFGRNSNRFREMISENYDYAFSGQMQSKIDKYQISRSSVYKMDSIQNLKNKLDAQFIESSKLALIHKGALATEIYQKIS